MNGLLASLLAGTAGLGQGLAEQQQRDVAAKRADAEDTLLAAQFANLGGRYGPMPALPPAGVKAGVPGLPPVDDPSIAPTSGLTDSTAFNSRAPRGLLASVMSPNGAPNSSTAASTIALPRRPFAPATNLRLDVPASESTPLPPSPTAPSLPGLQAPPTPTLTPRATPQSVLSSLLNSSSTPSDSSDGTSSTSSSVGSSTGSGPRYLDLTGGRYFDTEQTPTAREERSRLAEIALMNQGRVSVADVRASAGQLAAALKAGDRDATAQALRGMGLSDDEVTAALYSKGLADMLLRPNFAPSTASHDPNVSAAAATNRAIGQTNEQIAQTTRAMPKFNPMSLNPGADSTSVVAGRTAPLFNLGDLMARRDSLSNAYDQESSAIGTGRAVNGSVDNSGVRAQISDARSKLNAILSNPAAPLSIKAAAQDAYKNRLQSLGVGSP